MSDQKRQPILLFYLGEGTDGAGRTIAQVWAFDYEKLESVHDHIQWLFPSAKPSQFNKEAPLLDAETIAAFKETPKLKRRLLKSLRVMLDFYGLALQGRIDRKPVVAKACNYAERRANWQDVPKPGYINHNLLRLTRIIEALNVLGVSKVAQALALALAEIQKDVPEKIPARTVAFWNQAAGL